ncbi:GroES-like protein [Aureobasidium subglaciale]|nr:GroES-like protein [Aureobasidium subglaciale]KAI5228430.1 GroES-like protein [Aureobasidium subglaciale]KAI5231838.1 GroES-like protein [Aureobasidium subglaciale]KAI5265744.1 GroES-like protein [Aureobasidium subglaciale]
MNKDRFVTVLASSVSCCYIINQSQKHLSLGHGCKWVPVLLWLFFAAVTSAKPPRNNASDAFRVTDLDDQNPSFVLRAIKDVAFENRDIPKLRDEYEVRVQIAQTGICGSDVGRVVRVIQILLLSISGTLRGRIGDFILKSPIVLGHESSGTVVEVGAAVQNLKQGDRVAIEPGVPCRRCDYCRDGKYNLCNDTIFAATPPWDGKSVTLCFASDYCYKIPDSMNMEEAAMVEPTAVAVQIAKVADLRANQTVLVFGCGPIGVLCQAVAKAYGARKVIGVDVVKSRLDFAKSYGADAVYLPPKPDQGVDPVEHSEEIATMIKQEFGLGEGADVVLECTGAEPCIQTGVFATKKGGTYVQAGMGKENVLFPITTACIRALVIKGSIRYTKGCYPDAVHLIATGKIDAKRLITNRFKFEEAEKAFELVKAGREDVFKVIIEGVQS